jgi:ATP/maltotriose-dependent transcriptional regulator MalT
LERGDSATGKGGAGSPADEGMTIKGYDGKAALPAERLIIERPRLLKMLDDASARTTLLVAPAGYGKTVIASQWMRNRRHSWFRLQLASVDVAALARGLAIALDNLGDSRLVNEVDELLRVLRHPEREVNRLVQPFLGALERRERAWLVVDDYHVIERTPAAQQLIECIHDSNLLQLLIASRSRPSWATTRRSVYGEIHEIRSETLEFTDSETGLVLDTDKTSAELLKQAHGWPAVIGLIAVADTDRMIPSESVPSMLYEFFADEIFNRAPKGIQDRLLSLALLPRLDRQTMTAAFGGSADAVTTDARKTGLAHVFQDGLELHPLVERFLVEKIKRAPDATVRARASVDFAISQQAWDEALALIQEFHLVGEIDALVSACFRALLSEGRIATLEKIARWAVAEEVAVPPTDLIDAELAFRDGRLDEARGTAASVAERLLDDHSLKARAFIIAGSAAQLLYHLEEAHELHSRGAEFARDSHDLYDALWGQFLSLRYLERPECEAITRDLNRAASTPEQQVRASLAAIHNLRLSGRGLRRAAEHRVDGLLAHVRDARIRTSYANQWGYTLVLQARYQDAIDVASRGLLDVDRYHLSFARPHLRWAIAAAELGLRHLARADSHLRAVEAAAEELDDPYLQINARALRARLLLVQLRPGDAVAVSSEEWDKHPTRAMYAEYVATHALALAVAGEAHEAQKTLKRYAGLSTSIEVRAIESCATAVAALGTSDAVIASLQAFAIAEELDTWDPLLCTFRAAPRVLELTAANTRKQRGLLRLLLAGRDENLAKRVGLSRGRPYARGGTLSRREREVLDLLQQGLRNREVARALFIAESTVKVHVRHIMDKLGARTRAEAVARYTEDSTTEE